MYVISLPWLFLVSTFSKIDFGAGEQSFTSLLGFADYLVCSCQKILPCAVNYTILFMQIPSQKFKNESNYMIVQQKFNRKDN